jgi:hypothetical protein
MKAHLTYANVLATLAIFIALGGVSWAATQLPRNSVGTAQLKKNAVNSSKVKDRSLLAKDFKSGQLPKGATGMVGPQGDPGMVGPQGDPGANGATGVTGPIGPNGPQGPPGEPGKDGDLGPQGAEGPPGATGSSAPGALFGSSGVNLSSSGTSYLPISGVGSFATQSLAQTVAPSAMEIGNLTVSLSQAPGQLSSRDFFLTVNGALVLGCFIQGLDTACSSGSLTASVQKFDRLAIRQTSFVSATSEVAYSMTATAP